MKKNIIKILQLNGFFCIDWYDVNPTIAKHFWTDWKSCMFSVGLWKLFFFVVKHTLKLFLSFSSSSKYCFWFFKLWFDFDRSTKAMKTIENDLILSLNYWTKSIYWFHLYLKKREKNDFLDAKVFWKVQLIRKMSIEWLHPTIAFKKHTHRYHSMWTPMDVLWIFFWKSIIKLFQKTKDKKLWYNHCWIRQFINRWVFESIDSMFHLTTVYRYHRHL